MKEQVGFAENQYMLNNSRLMSDNFHTGNHILICYFNINYLRNIEMIRRHSIQLRMGKIKNSWYPQHGKWSQFYKIDIMMLFHCRLDNCTGMAHNLALHYRKNHLHKDISMMGSRIS